MTTDADLSARLRLGPLYIPTDCGPPEYDGPGTIALMLEAADDRDRLRAEVKKWHKEKEDANLENTGLRISLTQAQARATAAEAERDRLRGVLEKLIASIDAEAEAKVRYDRLSRLPVNDPDRARAADRVADTTVDVVIVLGMARAALSTPSPAPDVPAPSDVARLAAIGIDDPDVLERLRKVQDEDFPPIPPEVFQAAGAGIKAAAQATEAYSAGLTAAEGGADNG